MKLVALFFCCSVSLTLFCCIKNGSRSARHSDEVLNQALGPFRIADGRLVGLNYAPQTSTSAKANAPAIRELLQNAPSPTALRVQAIIRLAAGETTEGVEDLKEATRLEPRNSQFWSDLSAAYMLEAKLRGEPYYLFLALCVAEKANSLDTKLLEARFNRALALEKLFLDSEAKTAWEHYLDLDWKSPWAKEAVLHLSRLRRLQPAEGGKRRLDFLTQDGLGGSFERAHRAVVEHPQLAREDAERLLAEWAEARKNGRLARGDQVLATARVLAPVLAEQTGDHMLIDAVHAIDQALTSRRSRAVAALVEGHEQFWQGVEEYDSFESKKAEMSFIRAQALLTEGGSPFELWASFYRSLCEYRSGAYEPSVARLSDLAGKLTKSKRYPVLRGRVAWLEGLIGAVRGEFSESIYQYELALMEFRRSRQDTFQGTVHHLLAENLIYLGESMRAWRHLYEALRLSRFTPDSVRRLALFERVAHAALEAGEPRIALYFQREAIQAAEAAGKGRLLAGSVALKAEMEFGVGLIAAASKAVGKARRLAADITDGNLRESVRADIDRIEAQIVRSVNPEKAAQLLTSALSIYQRTEYHYQLAKAHLARAMVYLDMGSEDLAEADFAHAIYEVGRQGRDLADQEIRIAYSTQFRDIFDEALLFQIRRGRGRSEGFSVAELGRARALADLVWKEEVAARARLQDSIKISDVRSALPEDVALVEYAILPDRLLIWCISHRATQFVERSVPGQVIEASVDRLMESIAQEGAFDNKPAAALYDLLISPLADDLSGVKVAIFVPHKFLFRVPFGVLIAPSGRYFIEDRAVVIAPSATLYLASQKSRRSDLPHEPRVLVIGSPEIDRNEFPDLADLPGASEEIHRIATYFSRAEVAEGSNATKAAFLTGGEYDIIHYVGHGLPNPKHPLLSRFVLTPKPGRVGSGTLLARELYHHRFEATRLVTLSACGAASASASGVEGIEPLVHPLLASGIPSVVGSLWSVGDEPAAEFFSDFYSRLVNAESLAESLRGAQLHLLQSGNHELESPQAWAAFQLFL